MDWERGAQMSEYLKGVAGSERVSRDVGTVWTLRRESHSARCALIRNVRGWQLRVFIDGDGLLTEQGRTLDELLVLAESWKGRMRHDGWTQVAPGA
jgi:hypothetical protein